MEERREELENRRVKNRGEERYLLSGQDRGRKQLRREGRGPGQRAFFLPLRVSKRLLERRSKKHTERKMRWLLSKEERQ